MPDNSRLIITGGIVAIAVLLSAVFVGSDYVDKRGLSANIGHDELQEHGDMVTNLVTLTTAQKSGKNVTVSPSVSPLSPSVSPSQSTGSNSIVSPLPSSAVSPAVSPTRTPTATPTSSPTPMVTKTPSPSATPTPDTGTSHVVFNEIAWMGTKASPDDEWFELFNDSDLDVHLTGWRLYSTTGSNPDPVIDLSGLTIPANGYLVLERTLKSRELDPISDIAGMNYFGNLSNSGEVLELTDAMGNIVDRVEGTAKWCGVGNNDEKMTMERIDSAKDGDNCSNWATFNGNGGTGYDAAGNPINGTPGARNSVSVD